MGAAGLVAILFTDLVGSTETVARLGDRRADELREAYFALLREGIRAHGGEEVKNLGDGLMVAFGAASDAVAAAVAMQQAVVRHNRRGGEPLAMRVGVAVGEATQEDGDWFGTVVIEASRLCARAEGGEILVTEMAHALAAGRGGQDFVPLGPLQLKGLPAAVPVHRVRWEVVADAGPPLPARLSVDRSVVFIGRAAEREVLESAWKQVEQGALRLVLVAGEPGIGKTRLATEAALRAHQQGGLVLLGRCDEDLAVPYQPFVDALRHLVAVCPDDVLAEGLAGRGGELIRLLPEVAKRTPGLTHPHTADPDTERYLLFSAVAGLLQSVAQWRPVLLVLDDLHWATKPTLLLLKHLIRSSDPMALLVVGTYRDSDIGPRHPLTDVLAELHREPGVERLALRGLSGDEAVAMMANLAGHDLDGPELALAHAVHAEADGSPLFMWELLRHFRDRGELRQEGDRWTFRGEIAGIPDSVREVIGHRLSRLPEPVDRLLALGAVIGPEFDVAVLSPLAGVERSVVLDGLAAARQAAVVKEVEGSPGRFTFAHAVIRHTLYDELGPARQVELHRRVAETLEALDAEADVSELAHHWLAAIPQTRVSADDVARAARYAEQAGRRAMASLAYEEAAHHFEGALRAARQSGNEGQVGELLIQLGEAQRCAGDPAHRETLLEAGRLALRRGDPDQAARAALANQGGVFSRMGAIDPERVAALQAAIAAAGGEPTAVRAQLLASLATEVHFEEGEERRLELVGEALDVARQVGQPVTLAQVLTAGCLAAWGSTARALLGTWAAELHDLVGQLADPTLQFHASAAVFYSSAALGDMDRADAALVACHRIARDLGQPVLGWRVTHLETQRAMAAGRFDAVEGWCDESLRLGEASGQPDSLLYAHGPLAITRVLEGRTEEGLALVNEVVEQAPLAVYRGVQAWALADAGRHDEAREIIERLRTPQAFAAVPRDHHRPLTLCLSARTCGLLGDAVIAGELYDALLPFRSTVVNGLTVWWGPATHDLGILATLLSRYDEAEEHFSDAVQRQDEMGAIGTVVHTRLAWATMLRCRNSPEDVSRARGLLEAAKTAGQAVGVPHIEARVDAMLAG